MNERKYTLENYFLQAMSYIGNLKNSINNGGKKNLAHG